MWWWIWTVLAIVAMFAGVLGTFLPVLPGTALIFAAASLHFIFTGGQSVGWITLIVLALLALLAAAVDFLSGAAGAKYFGATRWGVVGGILGAIVGLFFGIPGLILGPLIGAVSLELIAGRKLGDATRSGIGTAIGTTAGILAKLIIALIMVAWFLVDLFV